MASTYLSRSISSTGNRKIATLSVWLKRGNVGGMAVFSTGSANTDDFMIYMPDPDIQVLARVSSSTVLDLRTDRVLRDVSAWYHVVVEIDTTQATASNRVKLYINGEQETSFSTETYPSQNQDLHINESGYTNYIGNLRGSGNHFDGLMTHFHLIDGTAYDADTFGQTDSTTGIWKPKLSPSVTYGTNGFFLKFENSGAMGTDSSGNTNTFAVSGGTCTQTIDTPTNNFNVMNSEINIPNATFSNGNTMITDGDNAHKSFYGTFAVSKGKYYWEAKAVSGTKYTIGLNNVKNSFNYQQVTNTNNIVGDAATSYRDGDAIGWYFSTLYKNGSQIATGLDTIVTNDIMQCAIDLDAGKIYFGRNGTWRVANSTTFDPAQNDTTFTTGEFYVPTFSIEGCSWETNFGNGYFGTAAVSSAQNPDDGIGIFEYTVPSGFKALCTKSINAQEYS